MTQGTVDTEMAGRAAGAGADVIETPSGKAASGENFPVGSFLIRKDLRRHVHTFYLFARAADDIADNPALAPDEKVRRLDRMAEILDGAPGDEAPSAAAMARRPGDFSDTITQRAPKWRAQTRVASPIGPAPRTRTFCAERRAATFTACSPTAKGSTKAPCCSSTPAGRRTMW